jgi:hypothetical protein
MSVGVSDARVSDWLHNDLARSIGGSCLMHIRQRLLAARNDARMSGYRPIRARISPLDMKELDTWIAHQSSAINSGLPPANLSKKDMFGMEIVEDPTVRDIIKFDMAPPNRAA